MFNRRGAWLIGVVLALVAVAFLLQPATGQSSQVNLSQLCDAIQSGVLSSGISGGAKEQIGGSPRCASNMSDAALLKSISALICFAGQGTQANCGVKF